MIYNTNSYWKCWSTSWPSSNFALPFLAQRKCLCTIIWIYKLRDSSQQIDYIWWVFSHQVRNTGVKEKLQCTTLSHNLDYSVDFESNAVYRLRNQWIMHTEILVSQPFYSDLGYDSLRRGMRRVLTYIDHKLTFPSLNFNKQKVTIIH
jgi:hypothetical protein